MTFSPHTANWLAWLGHLKDTPCRGAELGTYKGYSAAWFLENICTHPESKFYCVDTWEGSVEHHLLGIDCTTLKMETMTRLDPHKDRCELLTGKSASVLRHWDMATLDFGYVDASHDSLNVLRDGVLLWELLNVGGVLIFDDYTWEWMPEPVDNASMAINAFMSCYRRSAEVLPNVIEAPQPAQVALRKVHAN